MKIIQINAISSIRSTGKLMKELSTFLNQHNIENYQVHPLGIKEKNSYIIGNKFDYKLHALLSRITGLQGYFSSYSTKKLLKFFDEIEPDVVHLHNIHSNFLNFRMLMNYCIKKHISVIFTLHDSWFFSHKNLDYSIDKRFIDALDVKYENDQENRSYFFNQRNKIITDKQSIYSDLENLSVVGVSNWITKEAKASEVFNKNNNANFLTINNWIDLDIFKPINLDAKDNKFSHLIDDIRFKIICVASEWNEYKGVNIIRKLSASLPENMSIILVGKLNDNKLKNLKNIFWIDETENVNDLVILYNIADVCLNISIAESFGKVTAESLACGTPVIVSNSTASPELINENETGIILDDLSINNIIHALQNIEKNDKNFYFNKCRKYAVENFDYKKNAQEYINLYRMVSEREGVND